MPRLEVILTEEQHQQLKQMAQNARLNVSDFVRLSVFLTFPPKQLSEEDRQILEHLGDISNELQRMGHNLNQLTRAVNTRLLAGEKLPVSLKDLEAFKIELGSISTAVKQMTKERGK